MNQPGSLCRTSDTAVTMEITEENMRPITVLQALFLLSFSLMTAGCGEQTAHQAEPAQVVYSVVEKEPITLTNELPGRVSAFVVAEVRPQVDGIIQERLFEEGADVVQEQVLYQIDPSVYQAAYNTAKAALEEAEAKVVAVGLLEKRYRNLAETESLGRQDLDNAIAEHGQAKARVARMKAELEAAGINLAYTKIKAPVSGRIGRSSVTPGALVTANQPQALAVIQQTDRVYVDITQSSSDMIRLRRAMAQGGLSSGGNATKARLVLEDGSPYALSTGHPSPDKPKWILGKLLFSEISVGQTTGSVTIRAVFENPEGLLLPGMYVKAIIEEGTMNNALLIPQGSVMPNASGDHFVFVLQKNDAVNGEGTFQVARREVTLERPWGNRWIVKSGLSSGDLLVVEGLRKAVPSDVVKGVSAAQTGKSMVSQRPTQEAR